MRPFLFILLSVFSSCRGTTPASYSLEMEKMGSVFRITAIAEDQARAREAVEAAYREVDRIESLISSWDSTSQTAMINRNAGLEPVVVDKELYELIRRSISISELTKGVFDITFASGEAIWKFDGTMDSLPSAAAVAGSVELIDYRRIRLNPGDLSVFLERKGMRIGFGGIGKGYAANRCKALMQEMGIESGVVNAGGDLISWGTQENGADWTIGIIDPDRKSGALSWLDISGMAVVTSGNYERFVEFDGKRYSHIIDPRTGWPAESLKSVTIICPDAEVADALATSVFILGVEDGLALVNRIRDVECLIVDDNGALHHSEHIELDYYEK